jgi:protein-disulfide isomerase
MNLSTLKQIGSKLLVAFCSIAIFALPAFAEISPEDFKKAMDSYLNTPDGKKLVGSTVENYFKNRQAEMRREQQKAEEQEMAAQFDNPVDIPVGNSPTKGPKDAPITIIEFSDFQCPYCSRGNDVMMQVLKAYDGKVRLAFKNLPLPFHQEAKPAAAAALAAGEQGKFWEMHDAMFANQKGLNSVYYLAKAKELGLNIEKFKADMVSEKVTKQIEEDMELAKKHGISGTPGFFVNGVAVKGAQPFPAFKTIIDQWLEKKGIS